MKNMMKILTRYVLSAAGVALILLIINFTVFVTWSIQSGRIAQKDYSVSQFADGLTKSDGVYTLSEFVQETVEKRFQWAMLLALLFGLRLFRSLRPLAKGIEDMAEKRPVELSTIGLLGNLAAGINKTSAQLAKQEATLSKRDNARTTWIAGVSHDIRTPLSIVMGYASQLEDDPELTQSKREQAGIIRRQSEQIKTLVSDLNLASKLEYDMQPIRMHAIALATLLRQIVVDFLNSGLSDSGVGFKLEMLGNLNHPKSSAQLENHGLGLTIVRQIIKAHGGTTEFRNLPEGGCTVVLCLPVSVKNTVATVS